MPAPSRVPSATLLVVTLAVLACAHPRPVADAPAAAPDSVAAASDDSLELEIENHNWLDVSLYVLHDGMRDRVGLVTGSATSTLRLPARLVGRGGIIQLVAHPVGAGTRFVTEPVSVGPLRRVVWTLETDLARSSVASW